MDYRRDEFKPGPCPVCKKPESAYMGSSRWPHNELCCSEKCGAAYAETLEFAQLQFMRAESQLRLANRNFELWRDKMAERTPADETHRAEEG